MFFFFFFFNDTATTEIYTLSLHDALPICPFVPACKNQVRPFLILRARHREQLHARSEEHTSELQSQSNLVCRLLLEKKKSALLHLPVPRHHHQQHRNCHTHHATCMRR